MSKSKKTAAHKHILNTDRRNRKASKKRSGVAPGAHNGHSVGGYSIKKYGRELATELAEHHSRPTSERRASRRALRTARRTPA